MKMPLIMSLAAATALYAPAAAQQNTVAPPIRWEDTPEAPLALPGQRSLPVKLAQARPGPGVTWTQRGAGAVRMHQAPGAARMHPAPGAARMRHAPAGPGHQMRGRRGPVVSHHRGGMTHHRVVHRFPHHRIERGFVVPPVWWGPRHHIVNWGGYGLPQPVHGGRWIRYYDDALLIDSHGRVHDGRWGMKWDDYAHEWADDENGIPVYVGDGDYHPDDQDYAWVDGQEDRYAGGDEDRYAGHDEDYVMPHGGYQHGHPGYAYPAYGYPAYGWGGVVTVTETTVTPTVIYQTVHAPVKAKVKAKKRYKVRHKPVRTPVPYGEKG